MTTKETAATEAISTTTEVMLYSKHIKDEKNKKEFDKAFVSYNHKRFDCIISNDLRAKMAKAGMVLPFETPFLVEVDENDYFMKKKPYTDKNGKEKTKYIIVLLDYRSIKPTAFDKYTIDNAVEALNKELGVSDTSIDVKDDDLPF